MPIEALPYKAGGNSTAMLVCDDCGATEKIICAYTGKFNAKTNKKRPNAGQAKSKAQRLGWSVIRNKMRCQTCEAARKVPQEEPPAMQKSATPTLSVKPPAAEPANAAASEPTKEQKREIILALEDYYDTSAEAYKPGESDNTMAEICRVLPGWVAKIREEFFGPDNRNKELDAITKTLSESSKNLEDLRRAVKEARARVEQIDADIGAQKTRMDGAMADIRRIKSTLSPCKKKAI